MVAQIDHIVMDAGISGGKPRIAGHRITVQNVAIWHERVGMSADEIATEYHLTLGEIYAALAYYHDHRAEIDASIAADEALVEEVRRHTPSKLVGWSLNSAMNSLRPTAGCDSVGCCTALGEQPCAVGRPMSWC